MYYQPDSAFRRLPIYFLLDTSRSMIGKPIQAVNDGLKMLKDVLVSDPVAVESVYVSVIQINTEPSQVVPLTEVPGFTPPELDAGGWTKLGAALRLLNDCLDREIKANAGDQKGDYKPLVFLLSDGRPTDGWKLAIQELRARKTCPLGNFIALGCGPKADLETLSKIANVTLAMGQFDPEQLKGFFKWVSQSISMVSQSLAKAEKSANLPALPPYIHLENYTPAAE
jgi:uncharacterized protein YegL